MHTHGYNYNIYFPDEKFIMPSNLSLETYRYDEEWVILKKGTDDNDVNFGNICQKAYEKGDKVKCKFKDIDGGDMYITTVL